ncbi:MAG: L,D-transpeptidase [Pseudonocardia sp.]
MGRHSRTARPRVRVAITAGLVSLGALGSVGIGHADDKDGESKDGENGGALVEGTPCTREARACVDLGAKKAWLIADGGIVRGPLAISPGDEGRETPRGDFAVSWKNKDHTSSEFDNAPMPFAVFFAEGGIAFHEGNLSSPSAGCVRLSHDDAVAFFDSLEIGAAVQVR